MLLDAEATTSYLTDFGLTQHDRERPGATTGPAVSSARSTTSRRSRSRASRSTPRADVYALGCVLYTLLTGEVPFPVRPTRRKLWAHISEPPPKPSARQPGLGAALDPIVERAMAVDPADRFQSAGELGAADLDAAAATTPAKPPRIRRDALAAALTDPFNVIVLAALILVGALLHTVGLMVGLALAVYAVGVWRSYHDF